MSADKRLRHLETMEQAGGAGGVHDVLSATHTDSTAAAVVRGDLATGQGVIPTWTRLPIGGVNTVLTSDGTDAAWAAPGGVAHNVLSATHTDSTPAAAVLGDIMTAQAGPSWSRLAITVPGANVRNVLGVDNGDSVPAWKTALDANNPVAITVGAAALPGTSLIFSHRDHQHASPATWTATAHNLLSATHGDTTIGAVARGDIVTGQGVGATWTRLALGGIAGSIVTRDATDVLWSTYALSGTAAQTYTFPATSTTLQGGTGANPQVAYWSATANILAGDAGFTYDAANDSLSLLSSVSTKPILSIENTAADALAGHIDFYKNRGAPADGDDLGSVEFFGNDSGIAKQRYAYMVSEALDVTAGDEGGRLSFYVIMDATNRDMLTIKGYNGSVNQGEIILNDDAQDIDTRIEAVGVADALQVRGSDGQITLGVLTAGYVNSDAGGVLSVTATATPSAHAILSASHSNTTPAAVVRGDLMTGQNGPVWARLALGGATGSILTRNATDVLWSGFYLSGTNTRTYTFPNVSGTVALGAGTLTAATANDVTIAAHTHALTDTSDGAANHSTILSSSAAGAITMDDYFTIDGGQFGIAGNELLTVNAAGTWGFSGITGVTVEDADWIGNGAAAALLGFNSAGATDYAYFSNCYVGIGTIAPVTNFEIYDAGADPQISLTAGAAAQRCRIGATLEGATGAALWFITKLDGGASSEQMRIEGTGDVGIGITNPTAQLQIDQSSASGSQPVLLLDQGDVSEQHIVLSMSGADVDFPNILQLDVTGSPALWWDESQNSFGFKNVSGLLLEDIDWIGNSQTSARLTFDSSGTNYAYFTYCRVGMGITIPAAQLDIDQAASAATIPVLRLDQADVSEQHIVCSMSSADVDFPAIIELDVTGSPAQWWDESENAWGFKNISGLLVESGDWIGNSGTTARAVFAGTYVNFAQGLVYVNETANANMTQGITINQGANDNEIFDLKSSDVAHGATDVTETDTYFFIKKQDANAGGARLVGMRDADGVAGFALHLQGFLGENSSTTKDVDAIAPVVIGGHITSGASITNMNADGNVVVFRTMRGGAYETVAFIDVDGDIYYDGALNNYDDYDDALAVKDARSVLAGNWNDAITYNAEALAAMGVISLNENGTPSMVSHKRMTALMAGAIGQLYDRVKQLEARL